jgi:TetR/AcrR family transcriptional repressor of nem operon
MLFIDLFRTKRNRKANAKFMRTREFDTRQAIASAMEVFWRKGYKGASMTELLAAMGIGKGSFYAAFGSKHELYLQALRHFRDTGMLFKHLKALPEANFAYESLRKLFDQLIERTINEQKTCMLGKAVLEFRGQDPQVAEIVNMGISIIIILMIPAIFFYYLCTNQYIIFNRIREVIFSLKLTNFLIQFQLYQGEQHVFFTF